MRGLNVAAAHSAPWAACSDGSPWGVLSAIRSRFVVLGYTGALTYFAPLQPVLAVLSVVLLLVAVVVRLKGQFSCPVPTRERSAQA